MKKKIVVFTGAGVSQESGIPTFRDSNDGLYLNQKIEEAFSKEGWKKNKAFVLDMHNQLRSKMKDIEPNDAHCLISALDQVYDVTVVTQNIDNLHEKSGSLNVVHLHGDIFKSRSTLNNEVYGCINDINVGDKCPKGSQLRPHTVFFDEMVDMEDMQKAYDAIVKADILIIVGTSLSITYTISLLGATMAKEIYYIDPEPSISLEIILGQWNKPLPKYIKKKAVAGMKQLYKKLMK